MRPNRRTTLRSIMAAVPFLTLRRPRTASKSTNAVDADHITIENTDLRFSFDPSNGGLSQMVDKAEGVRFKDTDTDSIAWETELHTSKYERLSLTSEDATFEGAERLDTDTGKSLRLVWTNPNAFGATEDGEEFEASQYSGQFTLTVKLPETGGLSQWRLAVESDDDRPIKSLRYPYITGIKSTASREQSDALVLPRYFGRQVTDPMESLDFSPDLEYPSRSATMQFTAYTSDTSGLYIDARDVGGRKKQFVWAPYRGESLSLHVAHEFPKESRSTTETEYETTLGVLRGDWHDAVDRYRSWLDTSGWLSGVEPKQPEWLEDVGVTFKDTSYWRERFEDERDRSYAATLEAAKKYKTDLETPLNLLQSGWQTHGYSGHGDWFPPSEGVEGLNEHLSRSGDAGMPATLFYNPTFISTASDLWQNDEEKATEWLMKSADGTLSTEAIPGGTTYNVEITRETYRQRVLDNVEQLVELGANEVWLDGEPASMNRVCYATDHDHPVGPGSWYGRAVRELFADLDTAVRSQNSAAILSGEGVTDYLLPYQTVSNSRDVKAEAQGGDIIRPNVSILPIVEYGLGDYVTTRFQNGEDPVRGNPLSKALMRMMWARTLVFGTIPWLHLLGDPDSDEYYQDLLSYIGEIGDARTSYAKRFINTGRMLRTPDVPTESFSFYERDPDAELSFEKVRASAWQSERDERAVLLTNASPEVVSTSVPVQSQPFDVPTQGASYLIRNGRYETLAAPGNEVSDVSVELSPNDISVIVFSPQQDQQFQALESLVDAQNDVDEGSEQLSQAKRAFESANFERAHSVAQSILKSESTPENDTATAATNSTTEQERSSEAESTGLGLITGTVAAGISGAAAWLFESMNTETEENE